MEFGWSLYTGLTVLTILLPVPKAGRKDEILTCEVSRRPEHETVQRAMMVITGSQYGTMVTATGNSTACVQALRRAVELRRWPGDGECSCRYRWARMRHQAL